jgi:hypothetical protein|tara:strand:- start:46111 stop:46329 length:219 start_codon:yes stop_codon:yes gene_type:complete
MYSLSIHNITKIEIKVTKSFKTFASRDLVITSSDHTGKATEHTIGLFGGGPDELEPDLSGEITNNYISEDSV